MEEQSYAKHAKTVPMYHGVLFILLLLTLIGSIVNVWQSIGNHDRLYSASLILVLTVCVFLTTLFVRVFPLKAQDRAIRAEENFRHYVLTGKPLDSRLTIRQIIGLRFASDAEFPELARKAADENMPPDAIKKSVKNWRADHDRL
ncbi:MAG TPA: DUF6526 family protein [Bryobacteraceae bacterium]|nr:DUF6526 family protein [Bryobacteraceae bacterium]